jgi:hypothetical protein
MAYLKILTLLAREQRSKDLIREEFDDMKSLIKNWLFLMESISRREFLIRILKERVTLMLGGISIKVPSNYL